MEGSSSTAEYANSPETGAENTGAGYEPVPANCSGEVLRDVIGRNVMAWIDAGTVQQARPNPGEKTTAG